MPSPLYALPLPSVPAPALPSQQFKMSVDLENKGYDSKPSTISAYKEVDALERSRILRKLDFNGELVVLATKLVERCLTRSSVLPILAVLYLFSFLDVSFIVQCSLLIG